MDENSSTPAGTPRRRRTGIAVAGSLGALGIATAVVVATTTGGAAPTASASLDDGRSTVIVGRGADWPPGTSSSSTPRTPGSSSPASATAVATADQQIGVVDIDTVLGYANGEAAGTGMVLTADGEIVTNNHVVEGATSISVTVVGTGVTYSATVVGTDPTDDVAVLQLADASGLQVADFSQEPAEIGDAVTAVGNAGGTGGTPSAVSGTVTALDQSITATDGTGGDAEQLSGLIMTGADVEAGDSGGPLYDTASGEIVGMDTAASSGGAVDGYAIPISTALAIAGQIVAGVDDATIHQGYPAFLGVSVVPGYTGAAIGGVLPGGPAATAGLTAGDLITGLDGAAIGSADDLTTALAAHDPGDTVPVTWTDGSGATHSAQATLTAGPAD